MKRQIEWLTSVACVLGIGNISLGQEDAACMLVSSLSEGQSAVVTSDVMSGGGNVASNEERKLEVLGTLFIAKKSLLEQAQNTQEAAAKERLYARAEAKYSAVYSEVDARGRFRGIKAASMFYSKGNELLEKADNAEKFRKAFLYASAAEEFGKAAGLYSDLGKAYAFHNAGAALLQQADNTDKKAQKKTLYARAAESYFAAAAKYAPYGGGEQGDVLYWAGNALLRQADNAEERVTKEELYVQATDKFNEAIKIFSKFGAKEINLANALCGIGKALRQQTDIVEDIVEKKGLLIQAEERFNVAADLFSKHDDEVESQADALFWAGEGLLKQASIANEEVAKKKLAMQAAEKFKQIVELSKVDKRVVVQAANALWGLALLTQVDNTRSETAKQKLYEEAAVKFGEITSESSKFAMLNEELKAGAFYGSGVFLLRGANDAEGPEKAGLYGRVAEEFSKAADIFGKLEGKETECADALYWVGRALYNQAQNTGDEVEKGEIYAQAAAKYIAASNAYNKWQEKDRAEALYGAGKALYYQAQNTEKRIKKKELCVQAVENFNLAIDLFGGVIEREAVRADVFYLAGEALRMQVDSSDSQVEKKDLYLQAVAKYVAAAVAYSKLGDQSENRAKAISRAKEALGMC